jgi:hypothetical protein
VTPKTVTPATAHARIDDLATATRITGRFLDRFARLPDIPLVD